MKSLLRWTAASLAAVFLVSTPQKAHSQVFDGNSTTNWAAGTSWVGGVPPAGATAITFADAPVSTNSTNDLVGLTVTGINFTNGGLAAFTNTTNNTTSFTLNGNKIILGGNVVTLGVAHDGVPSNNRILRDVINNDLDMSASRTFTIGQAGTNNQSQTQHHLTVNGNIGETAPGFALNKAGAGQLTLNGNNTFTGGIQITAGTIQYNDPTNLGSNTTDALRSSNGTFEYIGTGNKTLSHGTNLYNTAAQGVTFTASGVGNANSTLTYNGTLVATGGNGSATGVSKVITLQGSNTGNNTFATNIGNLVVAGNSAVLPVGLTKDGTGIWILTGNNTYTGATTVSAGTLRGANFSDPGGFSNLSSGNTTISFNGGYLSYKDDVGNSTLVMTNRSLNLSGTTNQAGLFGNDSALTNNAIVYNGTFAVTIGTGNKTFTLQGTNTGVGNSFNAVISDAVGANATAGHTTLAKSGVGRWILTGNNTFTNQAQLNQGTLQVSDLQNKGTSSNLGTGSNLAAGVATIRMGNATITGIMTYTGAGSSSDRLFQIGQATADAVAPGNQTGGAQINNNGTGALNFTGEAGFFNQAVSANATVVGRSLTLGGSFAGVNSINAAIQDNVLVANGTLGGQTVRVIKNGATTWNLTAANTYTGNTTVTAGTLLINGSTAAGAMLVNSGTLGGNGTVGGAATISSGATLSPGNSPGLMTFSSGLTMGANSTIIWELTGNTNGGRGTNFDGVNVTGALAIDPTTNSILDTTGGLLPGDGFWAVNRSWLVYDSATNVATGAPGGSITGSLVSGLSGLPGTFSWRNVAGDVFLNYTASAIPEPSSLLLTVLGIAGFGLRRSRKNRA